MTRFAAEYQSRCRESSDIAAHLPYLYERAIVARTILELGVRSGNSTAALLAGAEVGGGHVWSVDIDKPRVPDEWFEVPLWTLIVGSDTDPDMADALPQIIDLLFIDTSHTYEHTLVELSIYGKRVWPGGCILLHDTELERPEAGRAEDPPYPVYEAVLDFIKLHPNRYDVFFVTGSYGLAIIEVLDQVSE